MEKFNTINLGNNGWKRVDFAILFVAGASLLMSLASLVHMPVILIILVYILGAIVGLLATVNFIIGVVCLCVSEVYEEENIKPISKKE